jgi:hypothetical protein
LKIGRTVRLKPETKKDKGGRKPKNEKICLDERELPINLRQAAESFGRTSGDFKWRRHK